MITIEPFRPEHVLDMDSHVEPLLGTKEGLFAMAQINAQGPGWTGFAEGRIIGACGIRPMWPGTGEAWGIFSPLLYKYRFSAVKYIRRGMTMLIENQGLQRVQATINASNPRALSFAKTLGFTEEGLMVKYHCGCDYWMVSRT